MKEDFPVVKGRIKSLGAEVFLKRQMMRPQIVMHQQEELAGSTVLTYQTTRFCIP
jgi:hypothetical protein